MPALIPLIASALTWLGRIGLAALALNEVSKLTGAQKEYINNSTSQAGAAGMTDDEHKKLVAATTYEQVEAEGKSPDDFWAGMSESEKQYLKFSPQTLRDDMGRTKFLGIAAALMFAASLFAGGVAAVRGVPILLKTLARLAEARAKGAKALDLMTIIEEGKILGISKVWVPGLVAGIAGAGGWLTNGMVGNLNDATLWGRIFLGQAADDFEKALRSSGTIASSGQGGGFQPTITQTKTAKPKMFLGVVYAGKLAETPDFVRAVDDKITSDEDLKNDIQINLTGWLKTIGDRLNYEVQVKFEPFDENNVKKFGTWLTLSLYYSGKGGKRIFIDEVLLGPFDPVVYYPVASISESIRDIASAAIQPEILRPTFGTNGTLQVMTKEGESISLFPSGAAAAPTAAAAAAFNAAPASAQKKYTFAQRDYFVERDGFFGQVFYREGGQQFRADIGGNIMDDFGVPRMIGNGEQWTWAKNKLLEFGINIDSFRREPWPYENPIGKQITSTTLPWRQFFALREESAAPAPAPLSVTIDQSRAVNIDAAVASGGLTVPTVGGERYVNTPGSVLNMRSAPGTSSPVVAQLPHGGRFMPSLLFAAVQRDGYTWQYGTYGVHSGYVATQFLQ